MRPRRSSAASRARRLPWRSESKTGRGRRGGMVFSKYGAAWGSGKGVSFIDWGQADADDVNGGKCVYQCILGSLFGSNSRQSIWISRWLVGRTHQPASVLIASFLIYLTWRDNEKEYHQPSWSDIVVASVLDAVPTLGNMFRFPWVYSCVSSRQCCFIRSEFHAFPVLSLVLVLVNTSHCHCGVFAWAVSWC
jgi:hypothetical protein